MPLRAAELEVLFTANTTDVEKAERDVKQVGQRIESKPIKAKVTADDKDALAGMDRVEKAAKKIVSQDTAIKLDADISRAEKSLARTDQRIQDLQVRALGGLDVTADTRRAEAAFVKTKRTLDALQSARTMIEIDADTSRAEAALAEVSDEGAKAGEDTGAKFGKSTIAALASIPIAGAIIGVGVAAGQALLDGFNEGLQQEVGYDRLQGLTGISEADALRLGRIAGEAYTRNFGESIEQNMDTARLALQFDLIDDTTTNQSAQRVIEGLSGIADVLGEDVQPIATAVTTLLRNGLAATAQDAYDIIAAGAREGLNRNEDLLDTLTEYPVVLTRLGITGQEMLGLLNQGLEAGARNTDVVADALKEFQIRATDASEMSAEGFQLIGLNAEEMTAKIAKGGPEARAGLDQVLEGLRNTEDPVARNAAAVALFGTKAEDLGAALFALDLDTAAAKFDDLQGSAQRMFDTLADNDASKIQSAQRNIEVAADGIKGALASAFSEPLGNFADFVSKNRGPVLQFFQDLVNGALDFGVSLVNSTADGAEAVGEFLAGPGADMLQTIADIQKTINPFADTSAIDTTIAGMRGLDDSTAAFADTLRDKGISALEDARGKFNDFADGAVSMGYLNDASLRLADSLAQVGVDGEGAKLSLEGIDFANLRSSDSGRILENQVRASVAALADEVDAAGRAGEGQEELAARYKTGTDALASQLTQMGLTQEQAQALIDTVLQTPTSATTEFGSNASDQQAKVEALATRIITLPDGSIVIQADVDSAQGKIDRFITNNAGRVIPLRANVDYSGRALGQNVMEQGEGGVVEYMARGGLRGRGLTPMAPVAQVVPASTWRVVGDRSDVPESFIPIDGSARSMAILIETMRRMGVVAMGDGGITSARDSSGGLTVSIVQNITVPPGEDPRVLLRQAGQEVVKQIPRR